MLIIFLLVAFDQIIKYIIYIHFMDVRIQLFNGFIGFLPLINREDMSIFNKELGMGLSKSVLIIINFSALIILIFCIIVFINWDF